MKTVKDINLLPARSRSDYRRAIMFSAAIAGGISLVAVALLAYLMPLVRTYTLKAENIKVLEEIDSISDIEAELAKYEEKQLEYQSMQDALAAIEQDRFDVLEFLEKLKTYIPENVHVQSLALVNGESLNVSFVTASPVDTAKLLVKLREMNTFENVDLSSIPINKGSNTINLNLKIKLR